MYKRIAFSIDIDSQNPECIIYTNIHFIVLETIIDTQCKNIVEYSYLFHKSYLKKYINIENIIDYIIKHNNELIQIIIDKLYSQYKNDISNNIHKLCNNINLIETFLKNSSIDNLLYHYNEEPETEPEPAVSEEPNNKYISKNQLVFKELFKFLIKIKLEVELEYKILNKLNILKGSLIKATDLLYEKIPPCILDIIFRKIYYSDFLLSNKVYNIGEFVKFHNDKFEENNINNTNKINSNLNEWSELRNNIINDQQYLRKKNYGISYINNNNICLINNLFKVNKLFNSYCKELFIQIKFILKNTNTNKDIVELYYIIKPFNILKQDFIKQIMYIPFSPCGRTFVSQAVIHLNISLLNYIFTNVNNYSNHRTIVNNWSLLHNLIWNINKNNVDISLQILDILLNMNISLYIPIIFAESRKISNIFEFINLLKMNNTLDTYLYEIYLMIESKLYKYKDEQKINLHNNNNNNNVSSNYNYINTDILNNLNIETYLILLNIYHKIDYHKLNCEIEII